MVLRGGVPGAGRGGCGEDPALGRIRGGCRRRAHRVPRRARLRIEPLRSRPLVPGLAQGLARRPDVPASVQPVCDDAPLVHLATLSMQIRRPEAPAGSPCAAAPWRRRRCRAGGTLGIEAAIDPVDEPAVSRGPRPSTCFTPPGHTDRRDIRPCAGMPRGPRRSSAGSPAKPSASTASGPWAATDADFELPSPAADGRSPPAVRPGRRTAGHTCARRSSPSSIAQACQLGIRHQLEARSAPRRPAQRNRGRSSFTLAPWKASSLVVVPQHGPGARPCGHDAGRTRPPRPPPASASASMPARRQRSARRSREDPCRHPIAAAPHRRMFHFGGRPGRVVLRHAIGLSTRSANAASRRTSDSGPDRDLRAHRMNT